MKVIEQNAVSLDTSNMTPYQVIERVGRTCYKSEDNITEDSAPKFVARLYRDGHHAMLEFGWVYIKINDSWCKMATHHCATKYINCGCDHITGSLRAFHDWFNQLLDLYYDSPQSEACMPEPFLKLMQMFAEKFPEIFTEIGQRSNGIEGDKLGDSDEPFTFVTRSEFINAANHLECIRDMLPHIMLFTTDRGITHELVRHRPCSFAMESTRYCNYGKDKFGGELTFIKPCFNDILDGTRSAVWEMSMEMAEKSYMKLIAAGAKPEAARDVLPHAIKADIWMCTTEDEWQHIIDLRYHENTGKAHPKMTELMGIAYPQLNEASEGRIR